MSRRLHRRWVPALALLAGVAACSSSTASGVTAQSTLPATAAASRPSATASTGPDACALLTPAEVAQALGASAASTGAPRGGAGWIEAQCEWTAGDASVSISLGSSASLAAKGVTVPLATYVAQRRATEGDGGYVLTSRAPTALVYRGDVLVQLIVFSKAGAVPVDVATSLAGLAIGRAGR